MKKHIKDTNDAIYTIRVPTIANLNLQNFSPNLFIKSPVITWLTPKVIKTSPSEKLTLSLNYSSLYPYSITKQRETNL